jgi:hypothetical protein
LLALSICWVHCCCHAIVGMRRKTQTPLHGFFYVSCNTSCDQALSEMSEMSLQICKWRCHNAWLVDNNHVYPLI